MSFIIDPNSVSQEVIKADLEAWLATRPDSARWLNFFDSAVGQTIIELISGLGAFLSYNRIAVKRETFLQHAKLRSSAIATAEYLGYSAYRGGNVHLSLDIVPSFTGLLEKFSIVGAVKDQDLIITNDYPVNKGIPTTIQVVIGTLKNEELVATSEAPATFRFTTSGISEDIRILINDEEVEHSSRLLDLVYDKFAAISNVLGSVDVFSLNSVTAPIRYTTGSVIRLDAIELKNITYANTDLNFDFGDITNIQILDSYSSEESIEDIRINAPLYHETLFVIRGRQDYKKSLKLLDTSIVDTNYRDVSAAIVELVYVRNLLPVFSEEEKQDLIASLSAFRPMGLEPPTIVDPIRVPLKLKFDIKLLTNTGTLESDIEAIMVNYEKKLGQNISFDTVENEVEDLDYIKIARVSLEGDTWESEKAYPSKIYVKPTIENGLLYKSRILRRSGSSEPDFATLAPNIGDEIEDNRLIWKCIAIEAGLIPDAWQADYAYNRLDIIQPTVPNNKAYQVVRTKNYSYSIAEVQKIEFSAVPASGKWRIEYESETTSDLNFNDDALAVQTALESLSNIGSGNVSVSGNYVSGFTIQFIGDLENIPISEFLFTSPGINEVQTLTFKYPPTSGVWSIRFNGHTTTLFTHNAPSATIKAAMEALPSVGTGNIDVSGNYTSGIVFTFKNALANEDQPDLEIASTTLVANSVSVLATAEETQSASVVAPAQDEIQKIKFSRVPNSGHWALEFNGKSTTILQYDSNAATVQAALEALPDIGSSNVVVSGGYLSDFSVSFVGALAQTNVDLLQVNYNSLMFDDSLGQSVNVVPSVITRGAPAAQNEQQKISFNLIPDNGTWKLKFGDYTTTTLAHNATTGQIQTALQALTSIGVGNALVSGAYATGIFVTFTGALAQIDLDLLEVVDSTLVLVSTPVTTEVTETVNGSPSAASEVQKVSFNEIPTSGFWSIEFDGYTTTPLFHSATNSIVQTALQSLPNIGSGNVSVSGDFSVGFTLTFQGSLENTSLPAISIVSNTLIYRTGVDQQIILTIEEEQEGNTGTLSANEIQTITFSEVPTLGQWKLSYNNETTPLFAYNASTSQIESAIADSITAIGRNGASLPNVSVGGDYLNGITIEFVNDLAEVNAGYLFEVIESTLTASPASAVITVTETTKGMFPANSLYDSLSNPISIAPSTIIDAIDPEPDWSTLAVGDIIEDNEIVWLALNIDGTPDYWKPGVLYNTADVVIPTDPSVADGLMFQCIGFLGVGGSIEPTWPLSIGSKVTSNDIEWTANSLEVDPEVLAYNEYYTIDQSITIN